MSASSIPSVRAPKPLRPTKLWGPGRSAASHAWVAALCLSGCTALYLSGCATPPPPSPLAAKLLEQQYGALGDPLVQRYVEGVLLRLASPPSRSAPKSPSAVVRLVEGNEPLAIAADGSTIILSQGMIRVVANEAELAFVLAHELAHQQLGHVERMNRSQQGMSPLSPSARQDLELSADKRAIALLAISGYDPRAAFGALRRTHRLELQQLPDASGYPELSVRLQEAEDVLHASGWQPPGTINRRDFVMIQRHLALSKNRS